MVKGTTPITPVITNYKVAPVEIKFKNATLHNLVKDMLPVRPRYRVSFNIAGNVSVANAIRRIIIGELSILVLDFELHDCHTDGTVTNDWLKNRLRLIPISQEYEHLTAEIDMRNNTTNLLTVYSSDIKFKTNDKPIESNSVCDTSFRIIVLEKGNSIKINNITTARRYGFESDGESTCAVNIIYKPIDSKHNDTPNMHYMQYDTIGNFEGTELLNTVCNNIIERLTVIARFIKDKKTTTYMENYNLILSDMNSLVIRGESHTVGGIITNYAYIADPTISHISYIEIHPSDRVIKIRWKHPTGVDIIHTALLNAIATFEQIKKDIQQ